MTLDLVETSSGWALRITVADEAEFEKLSRSGATEPGGVTMSVTPNLLPGTPFDIAQVLVRISPDGTVT